VELRVSTLPVRRLELVIDGGPRPRLGQALRELWAFRHTILAFAERDVRVKYKQTILGILWAIVQPLAFMLVFTVAFGRLAKVSGGGAPYPAFSLSALVAWTFLQTAVNFGANALLMDSSIIHKVYLPREVPVLGAVAHAGVDLAIGVTLVAALAPVLGAHVSAAWLLIPILAALLALLAVAVALPLAALNVYYRDFRYALPFALQLWLFASPVAYPLSVIPAQWQGLYVALNPAAGILDAFRRVLALGMLPDGRLLAASLAGTMVLLWAGYRLFKGLEPNVADVI
jgi:lipopolysaccharide transport system permease protein